MVRSRLFEAVLVLSIIGLALLLCLTITSSNPPTAMSWEIDGNGTVDYMFLGSYDTLYTFCGNNITAVRSDGSIAWTLEVPRQWLVLDNLILAAYEDQYYSEWASTPVVDEHEGYLYLYLTPSGKTNPEEGYESIYYDTLLMAIAPNGTVAWTHMVSQNGASIPFPLQTISGNMKYVVSVKASGDRIYLFHSYKEDVFDRDGRLLFTLSNISAPVSVDADGRIYAVKLAAVPVETLQAMLDNSTLVGWNRYATSYDDWNGEWKIRNDADAQVLPSGIVEAYAPDGTSLWRRDLGEGALWQPLSAAIWQNYNTLPLYVNDTLYVPLYDGVAALDKDGSPKWASHIEDGPYRLFEMMPIDKHGNVYLQKTGNDKNSSVYMIDSNGRMSAKAWNITNSPTAEIYQPYPAPLAGREGVVYVTPAYPPVTIESFNETMSTLRYGLDTIEAIDLRNNRTIWSFTVPAADKRVVALDRDNAGNTNSDVYERLSETVPGWAEQNKVLLTPVISKSIQVYPGDGVTYVNYQFSMYDEPVIYNLSRRIEASGLYALDQDGRLLWEKPEGPVGLAIVDNQTLYYADGGRLGGRTVSVTAGFAFAALAYLFLRFFMVGAVARARGRLDENENRNRLLRYVADNPGATATDVSRETGVNMGTARYHLFILTLNHKIVAHREDDKYLRYFRNSGTFTETERSLLSLMRREPLRRVLLALADKPGLSGQGLAKELDVSATAANRHVATLAERGIIEQVHSPGKGSGYVIKPEHREAIGRLMGRL